MDNFSGTFTDEQMRFYYPFAMSHCYSIPLSTAGVVNLRINFARFVFVERPHFMLSLLRRGAIICSREFVLRIGPEHFSQLRALTTVSAARVLESILPVFSDDPVLREIEEHVFDFLQVYLRSCSRDTIVNFLRFVTGSATLLGTIRVTFNGVTEEELMFPRSSTCARQLILSRYIQDFAFFSVVMNNLLQDNAQWEIFDTD